MWVEAVGKALTYKFRHGPQITLEPGQPIRLPDFRGMQLLTRRPGQVRMVRPRQALEVKRAPPKPDDRIEWVSAEKTQVGLVDSIHVDNTGQAWAFVIVGESWAAVNVKFATLAGKEKAKEADA